MQAVIDISAFKKALTLTRPARGGALPILRGVLLEASNDHLCLRSTNLDTTIEVTVPAQVREPGATVVAHKALLDAIGTSKGIVELSASDEQLECVNGLRTVLQSLPIEEWPSRAPGEVIGSFPLDLAALAAVVPAAQIEEARPILCGVYFSGHDMVATDSHRLHLVSDPGVDFPDVLVPAKVLAQVIKHNKPAIAEVTETDITITTEDVTWTSRLIEGDYPNYRQLIQTRPSVVHITVDRAELIHGLEALRKVADKVRIVPGDTVITVSATNYEGLSSSVDINADIDGTTHTAYGYDPALLSAVAKVGWNQRFTFDIVDPLKPVQVVDTDADGRQNLRLLMPVRLL